MKDVIKLLLLLLPLIKDAASSVDDMDRISKKKRVLRILERRDLTRLEKLERILFRKSGRKVEIYGYVVNGVIQTKEKIGLGVIVDPRVIESYYDIASQLKRKD